MAVVRMAQAPSEFPWAKYQAADRRALTPSRRVPQQPGEAVSSTPHQATRAIQEGLSKLRRARATLRSASRYGAMRDALALRESSGGKKCLIAA